MQRDCGRCAGAANTRLGGEIIACVAMLEDPGDKRRVGDGGDDTHCCATARTATEVDREHAAQEIGPGAGFLFGVSLGKLVAPTALQRASGAQVRGVIELGEDSG